MAQPYIFGAFSGCGQYNEFGPIGQGFGENPEDYGRYTCSHDYLSYGIGSSVPRFTDTGLYKMSNSHPGYLDTSITDIEAKTSEIYGQDSKCFQDGTNIYKEGMKGLNATGLTGNIINVTFANGTSVMGTKDFEVVYVDRTISNYTIFGPNLEYFCKIVGTTCPNSCSGNGIGVQNGYCFCFDNYIGVDCSIKYDGVVDRYRGIELPGKSLEWSFLSPFNQTMVYMLFIFITQFLLA